MKQLISDGLNGLRTTQTICTVALCTLDRDIGPQVSTVGGNWRIAVGEEFHGKTAVDCKRWLEGT